MGQELGPREALHAWPTGEEGDKTVQPWARDRRRHKPFKCVESGWGREDLACRASSHGKTPGKFINVFYTHDWGTVSSVDVTLYPDMYKYKYVFTTFYQTIILIFTQENMYLTL